MTFKWNSFLSTIKSNGNWEFVKKSLTKLDWTDYSCFKASKLNSVPLAPFFMILIALAVSRSSVKPKKWWKLLWVRDWSPNQITYQRFCIDSLGMKKRQIFILLLTVSCHMCDNLQAWYHSTNVLSTLQRLKKYLTYRFIRNSTILPGYQEENWRHCTAVQPRNPGRTILWDNCIWFS